MSSTLTKIVFDSFAVPPGTQCGNGAVTPQCCAALQVRLYGPNIFYIFLEVVQH